MGNVSTNNKSVCPVCGSSHWDVFFEMPEVPIFCNILWLDKQAAQNCSRGDIRLAFCSHCGFIGNVNFNPSRLEYTEVYENSLDFSPRFQEYAKSIAQKLIKDYDLHDKDIIEIGCGKGNFLVSLCELGNNRGVGFDPTYIPLPEHEKFSDRIKFIQDLYSEEYADYKSDFIACRHTLEHIQYPNFLLKNLRKAIGDRLNTSVFFEVPNGLDTFRDLAIWDIIYEHCCFFTPASLTYAFSACGFEVKKINDEFRGQFLCLEVTPKSTINDVIEPQKYKVKELANNIAEFSEKFKQKSNTWRQELEDIVRTGKRAVVWGGGSKGVTFLNLLNIKDEIEYVVDINPRKQGMYIAGSGQKIVSPEFLQDYQPDVVIVMNSIYKHEIQSTLSGLGITPKLFAA